jgi:RimJ/RimL family protein N-acetyltransferase
MNILWGSDNEPELNDGMAGWCALQIGLQRGFTRPFTTMGVFDGEDLIGVTVFHNFQPQEGVIEISGASASAKWLPRKVLFEKFSYIFEQLRCQLCVMRVSERNDRMIAVAKKYGFTGHLIPRLRGHDEAEWIFTLADNEWQESRFHRRKT